MKLTSIAFSVLLLALPLRASDGELAKHPRVADAIALLDLWIEEQRSYHQLPGLAIGVVHDQQLVWARGYGVSDLETGTPMTPETVFRIASITKLFTATAIMKLRDAGKLRLDDPVSEHLPWFAVHSAFEGEPEITVTQGAIDGVEFVEIAFHRGCDTLKRGDKRRFCDRHPTLQ